MDKRIWKVHIPYMGDRIFIKREEAVRHCRKMQKKGFNASLSWEVR